MFIGGKHWLIVRTTAVLFPTSTALLDNSGIILFSVYDED